MRMQNAECRMQNAECRTPNAACGPKTVAAPLRAPGEWQRLAGGVPGTHARREWVPHILHSAFCILHSAFGVLLVVSFLAATPLLFILGVAAPALAKPAPPPPPADLSPRNGGFESGVDGWRQERPAGFAHGSVEVLEEGAAEGRRGIRLAAPAGKSLTGLTCDPVPVPKGGASLLLALRYRTTGQPTIVEVRVRPLDDKGQGLVPWQDHHYHFLRLPPAEEWTAFSRACVIVPEAVAYDITLWVGGDASLSVDAVTARQMLPGESEVPSQAARLKGVGGDGLAVWVESSLKKVYRDAKPPKAQTDAVAITAARGECEAFQIVLRPESDLFGVRVRWRDLLGPGILRREFGRAAWVDYVNVTRARAPLGRAGWTPDPLPPDDRRDVRAGQVQPLWLTLEVPRDAAPGIYRGRVAVEYEGGSLGIPVCVRVRRLVLPAEPALATIARISKCQPEGRDPFRRNLRAHRVSGEGSVRPLPAKIGPDGSVSVEFTAFDAEAERYFGRLGMRVFNFPATFLGDAGGFYAKDRKWNGLEILSPEFDRAFTSYVRQVADHLRAKGWLRYAIVQLWDEPQGGEMRDVCRRLASLVRAAAPDARIYLTTPPQPDLLGSADIWNLPLPDGFSAPVAAARKAQGEAVWGYDNRLYALDVDNSSIAMRAYPWRLKRFGIAGVEWWSVSNWTGDPYAKPNQYEPQNGGGFLLYPNRAGKGAPVDSVRWEMYREGVEDYDALTVLERSYEAVRKALAVQDARFSAADLLERLTRPVALTIADATTDPQCIQAARERVDSLAEFFAGEPRCLLRFEGEGADLRVRGVTLPGAEVWCATVRAPVDAAGRFTLNPIAGRLDLSVRAAGKVNRLLLDGL